jgi:hypothetical protein
VPKHSRFECSSLTWTKNAIVKVTLTKSTKWLELT